MAIEPLNLINESDTLSEGREKINSSFQRINEGEFTNLYVEGDGVVTGELRVNNLVTVTETETSQSGPVFTVSKDIEVGDTNDRGIAFEYITPESQTKIGFFGWAGYSTENGDDQGKFKFIPDASQNGEIYSGAKGIIDAKLEASDILNAENLIPTLSTNVVTRSTAQTIQGSKTFESFLLVTNVNQGTQPNHALPASRTISTTGGILIEGGTSNNLQEDVTLSIDDTEIVKTSGNQAIEGQKTFQTIIASDTIQGTVQFVENGVYTTGDQSIFGNKVFRRATTQDGIQLLGRNGGTTNKKISITPETALTADRIITLPNENVTIVGGTLMSLEKDQTITSEKTFEKNILFDITNEKHGIQGFINGDDHWFVGGFAESGEGYAEIATGSGGTEPIYARQYNDSPLTGTVSRTATLLDESGNTQFPGIVTLGGQATQESHAVQAGRTISAGDGLSGGGNLTANRTLSVNNTVVRTSGNQILEGQKTFGETIYASDGLVGNASTATQLENPVNINGVPFDGSQNITVGAAVDGIFYESLNTVTQNYTVPTDTNAMAIGPITLEFGAEITISEGSTFRII